MGKDCGSHGSSAVMLVVESDVFKRTTKARDLRREGFEVLEATDIAEAIAVLEATAIDVVFSDIDLIDGPALAQWVEERKPASYFVWTADLESD